MYAELPRPTIFAHRGSSAYAPENTIAAFDLAIRQQADAIELDAKLSADDQIVVIHDQTIDRTSNGKGRVDEFTLTHLKEFDVGEKYDLAYTGEKIPTLDEVFEAVGHKIFINIELTNYASPRDSLAEKVAKCVSAHNLENEIIFSSFNPLALKWIKKILPESPIGLLALPGASGLWARSFLGRFWVPYQALHPEVGDTHPSLVRNCHKRGYRVHTYTVNHPGDMDHLFELGVDGIFTDDPPLALRILKRNQ